MKSSNILVLKCLCRLLILNCILMCWARETWYSPITDFMPINRYKKLRQYLHFSDNSKIDDAGKKRTYYIKFNL